MKYLKILLFVTLLAMLLCSSVFGEASVNYTAEEARQIVNEFVNEELNKYAAPEYLKLESDKIIKGPNNESLWKFSIKVLSRDEPVIVTFDATYGYISKVTDDYFEDIFSPEKSKSTIKEFLSLYDIDVEIKDMKLRKGYPIDREWLIDIQYGQDVITSYIEFNTGGFNGYQVNDEDALMFNTELSSAIEISNDFITSHENSTVELLSYYPTKDAASNYIWKLKKEFNGDNYMLHIDANDYKIIKLFKNGNEYLIDNTIVVNEFPIYDKDYCKKVAKDFSINYLGINEDFLEIDLEIDQPWLPWFNDNFDYIDKCWIYDIHDDKYNYSISISACTGQVIEFYNYSKTTDDLETPIDKDKAKSIAEEFLKTTFPNKFEQTIYTGNESVYKKEWTVHEYTKMENNIIYANQVLNVCLNPNGSISHFYQSFDDIGMDIPYK